MNKLEIAARQALEALREYRDTQIISAPRKAIEALREALDHSGEANEMVDEQAEQEPVAWAISHSLGLEFGSKYPMQKTKEAAEQMARQHMGAVVVTPLYAAPVRTKDLTPHEITALIREGAADGGWQGFAQRVIAADRAKNNLCGSANAEEKNK